MVAATRVAIPVNHGGSPPRLVSTGPQVTYGFSRIGMGRHGVVGIDAPDQVDPPLHDLVSVVDPEKLPVDLIAIELPVPRNLYIVPVPVTVTVPRPGKHIKVLVLLFQPCPELYRRSIAITTP